MTLSPDPRELVDAPDRAAWRAWLAEHHAEATGARLILTKKGSGRTGIAYDEAVEEALCFGWIDSRADRLDDERYVLRFTPRKRGSVWAESNKGRVERLEALGLMTPAGRALVDAAKADGSWDALERVDDLTVPDDLTAAFAGAASTDTDANVGADAESNFAAFPTSTKRAILFWIASAKRPETRAKRIAETVRLAALNLRATEWRPKRNGDATGD